MAYSIHLLHSVAFNLKPVGYVIHYKLIQNALDIAMTVLSFHK